MRIALDTQPAFSPKTGIGRYARQLAVQLKSLAPQHEFIEINLGREVNMHIDRRLRWQQIELVRRVQRARVDLLHLTGFDAPLVRPARKVVMTLHDVSVTLFPQNFTPMARFYWGRWLPFTGRFADAIITDSESSRQDILRIARVPAAQVFTIPLGLDASAFHPSNPNAIEELRRRYDLPQHFILHVGTIEVKKGTDTLIEAFAKLAAHSPYDLVIVGKHIWHGEFIVREISKRGLEKRVRIIPPVSDADLPLMYAAAEVFAFPCRYEGFGLPVLEAMACGTPVVCANTASLPEVAGDGAWLIPPADPDSLARALETVLTDSTLADSLRAKGFANAKNYTWERTARATLAVYEQVTANIIR